MYPKISFIAPSHRTQLWKPFFESIVTNLDFNVTFVSDIEPKEGEVPSDQKFRYILSQVKPAQCFELAYRYSDGDFVIWTGDDFTYSPYAIDNAYLMHKSFYDYKVMISFDVYEDGYEATKSYHKVPWDEKIQLTTSALISRKAIEEVGGWGDINFVCGHHDVDLQMRIYANGGRMFVCPNAFAFEPHNAFHKKEANFALDWSEELKYFTECWKLPDNTTSPQRLKPFIPYSIEDILTKSQGVTGKWK